MLGMGLAGIECGDAYPTPGDARRARSHSYVPAASRRPGTLPTAVGGSSRRGRGGAGGRADGSTADPTASCYYGRRSVLEVRGSRHVNVFRVVLLRYEKSSSTSSSRDGLQILRVQDGDPATPLPDQPLRRELGEHFAARLPGGPEQSCQLLVGDANRGPLPPSGAARSRGSWLIEREQGFRHAGHQRTQSTVGESLLQPSGPSAARSESRFAGLPAGAVRRR